MGRTPVPLWWEAIGERDAPGTVVLVPDAQRPAAYWPDTMLDGLCDAGWRVVRLDLRDQGRSPWTGGEDRYSLEELAGDVAAVCQQAAPGQRCHLLGHGLGGSVALHLAIEASVDGAASGGPWPAVSAVTVSGGTGWFADPTLPGPGEPVAVGLMWRTRMGEGEADRLARAIARELRVLMSEGDDVGGAAAVAEVEHWLAWGFNPRDGHRRAWLEAPNRWSALGGLRVPLTAVHGGADPLVPLAHAVRLAATVPGAQLVEVEDGGHALTGPHVGALLAAVGAVEPVGLSPASPPKAGRPGR
ncbi:MAG: hypothetical protein QOJ19_4515 [Acidimicrobiia bacterium]|jgi:pimeloyl-ACP methyl ester carboxylesterase|nr:hypothetical protein [Acidimicrobiia bacterium]